MERRIRLFIVLEKPCSLEHEIELLSGFADLLIVGTACSGEEALLKISELPICPELVLFDLGLSSINGLETIKCIKAYYPSIEVLIHTMFLDPNKLLKAIEAGASGYVRKDTDTEKIYRAIVEIVHGGLSMEFRLTRKLHKYFSMPRMKFPLQFLAGESNKKNHDKKATLTIRELECLQIVAKGLSNHEAASVLKLSKATVRTHLEHIYQKLDVTNRVEAITEGIRQGIINL